MRHCHNCTWKYKKTVELRNPNTCAEVKCTYFYLLCVYLLPALKIVCRETEVLNTVSSG